MLETRYKTRKKKELAALVDIAYFRSLFFPNKEHPSHAVITVQLVLYPAKAEDHKTCAASDHNRLGVIPEYLQQRLVHRPGPFLQYSGVAFLTNLATEKSQSYGWGDDTF